MAPIAADRLYLGDTLIADSTLEAAGTIDTFGRASLGPEYEVVSVLRGSTYSAQIIEDTLTFSGYTPVVVRDFGGSNGSIKVRGSQLQNGIPQIVFRYVDNDNWLSWTPSNASNGRFRVRLNGVSIDTTLPQAQIAGAPSFRVTMSGEDISLYRNEVLVASLQSAYHADATRHGFGSASAVDTWAGYSLEWQRGEGAEVTPPATYFDATSTMQAIEAASTPAAFDAAIHDLRVFHNMSIKVEPPEGIVENEFKVAAVNVVRALAAFPFVFRGSFNPFELFISQAYTLSGRTFGSRVEIRSTPTASQFDSVDAALEDSLMFITCHELAHLIHLYSSAPGATQLSNAFVIANPPGFSYGGDAIGGPRPMGFCRGYGTQDIREDIADVFGWMMTPSLIPQLNGWLATDAYLADKVAAVKDFTTGLGWPADHFATVGA